MDNTYDITISNKRIYDFYNTNPNVNIESMNLILLDFLDTIGKDLNTVMRDKAIDELSNNIKDIKQQVLALNDGFSVKLHEYNKEYIDTMKTYISLSSSENRDIIIQLLNKNTDTFINKISQTAPETTVALKENMDLLRETMARDIKEFVSSNNQSSDLKEFVSQMDSKILSIQQSLYSVVSSNQENLSSKLDSIKENAVVSQHTNDKVMNELNEFLFKYKTSSQHKGAFSEIQLQSLLNKMYPTAEIVDSHGETSCCDFIIKRTGKDDILIENKNFNLSVDNRDISKFLFDADKQKSHAIMLSQQSGITGKPDGFIELNGNKVIMYLHEVNYNTDKIRIAVNTVDHLSVKLNEISGGEDESLCITKDALCRINDEYQMFLSQRSSLQGILKDFNKKMNSQIESIQMPTLNTYLSDKFASIENKVFVCEHCELTFKSKRALTSHGKVHTKKAKVDIES
jgi:hypothetical protein